MEYSRLTHLISVLMPCCGSGQRSAKNKAKKAASATVVAMPQKGIALKIATQATQQIAAQIRKFPHLIQNRAM